jgi:hypothetical protein
MKTKLVREVSSEDVEQQILEGVEDPTKKAVETLLSGGSDES